MTQDFLMEHVKNFKFVKKPSELIWSKTPTIGSIPRRWSSFVCFPLERLIPCLEFTIEIESNSLMFNPNKEIRDRVFPVKIGKFSFKYYTFFICK